MKIKFNYIGLAILTTLLISCNQFNKTKDFDYGKVENGKYLNSFFGFEVTLPSDWIVQTKEQTDELSESGKDIIAGDNKNTKAILNASEINSANLLAMFKYEKGAAVDFNPNFIIVAENLKKAPGIKNGGDYLFQTRKLLKQSQLQYDSLDEKFKKEIINNQEFYVMNASIKYMETNIKQSYYSTLENGFCISAIMSYVDDEQKTELEKVFNSMKFGK